MQIVRNMLTETTKEFEDVLKPEKKVDNAFSSFLSFKSKQKSKTETSSSDNRKFAFWGCLAAASIGVLTYASLKNLQKTAKIYEGYKTGIIDNLSNMTKGKTPTDADKNTFKNICKTLRLDSKP